MNLVLFLTTLALGVASVILVLVLLLGPLVGRRPPADPEEPERERVGQP